MNEETYRAALSESSQLKLRAVSILAEGEKDASFRASILFHAAARAERRAIAVLEAPPPEARLRGAVEQCGCFIDGLDPSGVFRAWGQVLEASEQVPAKTARAIRARLDPHFSSFSKEYSEVMAAAPELAAMPAAPRTMSTAVRARAKRELGRAIAAFPGDPTLWWIHSTLAIADGNPTIAWSSIQRSRELDPEDPILAGAAILLVPDVLPEARASDYLDAAYATIKRDPAQAELCLCFAIASLLLARKSRTPQRHWERAFEVAGAGEALPPALPKERDFLRALRRIAGDLLRDRTPGVEVLYRVGLGALVSHAEREGRRDPVEILALGLNSTGGRMYRAA